MRILFVDDEPNILHGLRRMLHPMRDTWELTFADGGEQALAAMENAPFDIVVSDLRMPGMDGVRLLEEIRRRSPQTVRIALSGYADREATLRAATNIHQFLTKPCSAEHLIATLERACTLSSLLSESKLRALVAQMTSLPSLQNLVDDVVERLSHPDTSLAEVAELIGRDAGLSGRVLHLVNSSFFGVRHVVASPLHATVLLGLNAIKTLVLSVRLFQQFENGPLGGISLTDTWEHSVHVARAAKAIALYQECSEDLCEKTFLAGLLHDVGKLILASNLPESYAAIVKEAHGDFDALLAAERSNLGATHGEVGAYLLGLWGFAEDIVEAIALHHEPVLSKSSELAPLAAVHVANSVINSLNAGEDPAQRISVAFLERFQLGDRVTEWIRLVEQSETEEPTP